MDFLCFMDTHYYRSMDLSVFRIIALDSEKKTLVNYISDL